MSGAQIEQTEDDGASPPVNEEVERVARANGWKPFREWKGDPAKHVSADVFVARGLETPAILADRNKVLSFKLDTLERTHQHTTSELRTKLDETLGTVATMTTMMRSAEARAYERAKRELKAEMAKAVETADTAQFQRLQGELDDLEKAKPDPVPPKPVTTTTPPLAQTTPVAQPPEVTAFFERNPWYQVDQGLRDEADIYYGGLMAQRERRGLTHEQVLAEVERRMKQLHGDRLSPQARQTPQRTEGGGERQQQQQTEDDDASPMVTPSSGGGNPQPRKGRWTFDAMPKESKDAYAKYAEQLRRADENAGRKTEPLSKAEWARDYWSQDPNYDGA